MQVNRVSQTHILNKTKKIYLADRHCRCREEADSIELLARLKSLGELLKMLSSAR